LLVARLEALYPQAREAHTLVMGHLHHPQEARVGGKRLLVSPSWTRWMPWGYVAVEGGEARLVRVDPEGG
ncbi:hypothetical protein VSU19_00010, partial [Verrucomicrobiales bacterium BCK34]|nr:hypothetical protein [Verrucomicrobiales bacterium BCK34]